MKCFKHPTASFYQYPKKQTGYCRACHIEKNQLYERRHPERVEQTMRRVNYKRRYGITVAQYETMRFLQRGRCAICSRRNKLVVDHCHRTKRVRGLLCTPCNLFLGHYEQLGSRIQKYLGE